MYNTNLLAQHNEIVAFDIVADKVAMLNRWVSPIDDAEIEDYLQHKPLKFHATLDPQVAYGGADFVISATNRLRSQDQLLQYVLGRGGDSCRDGDQSTGDDGH